MEKNFQSQEPSNQVGQPFSPNDEARIAELDAKFSREKTQPVRKQGMLLFGTSLTIDEKDLRENPRFQAFQQIVPNEDIAKYMSLWKNGAGEIYDLLYEHSFADAKKILYDKIKLMHKS